MATELLLDLRQKWQHEFDDKKTRKGKLWHKISQHLEQGGFYVGEDGGERCRQKFANLIKSYMGYIKHQKKTGAQKNDDIPDFFDKIHSIIAK